MTWCVERAIELRGLQLGKPDQNAFLERFHRTSCTEVLQAEVFESLDHSALISRIWLQSDNEDRPHDAVAGLSPVMDRAQLEAEVLL